MRKHESPGEWDRREQELETMGFKGGQGRSNHEIYETAKVFSMAIWIFILLVFFIAITWIIRQIMWV